MSAARTDCWPLPAFTRLISREDILPGGVRAFPDALLKLFAGQNIGKLVLAVP